MTAGLGVRRRDTDHRYRALPPNALDAADRIDAFLGRGAALDVFGHILEFLAERR